MSLSANKHSMNTVTLPHANTFTNTIGVQSHRHRPYKARRPWSWYPSLVSGLTRTYTCKHTHAHTRTHARTQAHVRTHPHAHKKYARLCTLTLTLTHARTRAHTHTYTHSRTHTRIYARHQLVVEYLRDLSKSRRLLIAIRSLKSKAHGAMRVRVRACMHAFGVVRRLRNMCMDTCADMSVDES